MMTKEELLDQLAIELLRVAPQSARDAYRIAEDMVERRQQIFDKWALAASIADESIDQLGLTVRSSVCLKAVEIYTITQLLGCTEQRLLKTPNLGRKSLNEIVGCLNARGLKLKGQT